MLNIFFYTNELQIFEKFQNLFIFYFVTKSKILSLIFFNFIENCVSVYKFILYNHLHNHHFWYIKKQTNFEKNNKENNRTKKNIYVHDDNHLIKHQNSRAHYNI